MPIAPGFEPVDHAPVTHHRLTRWQRMAYFYRKVAIWLGGAFLIAFAGAVIFGPDFLKIGKFALFYWVVTIICGIALVLYGPLIMFGMFVMYPMRSLMDYVQPIIDMFKGIDRLLSGEVPDYRVKLTGDGPQIDSAAMRDQTRSE